MNGEKIVKSTQEQAVTSWINYLNQMRINELLKGLSQQDINLDNALKELGELKESVSRLLQTNRGGTKGIHGFIAERMQVYFKNARNLVEGAAKGYFLIDDNGSIDYTGNGIDYQQKFVGKHLSLDAVKEHLEKYPDYIKNGGKYQIPKDYYERLEYLLKLPEAEGAKLAGEDYRLWKYVHGFFQNKDIAFSDIEPSVIDYGEAQRNAAGETISREEQRIRGRDQEERQQLYLKSRPFARELYKTSAVSMAAEGGMAFCMGVYRKRKAGKRLSQFDGDDWKELGIDTAGAGARGGIRGAAVYGMSNFTATPAAVASAFVTAAFGVFAEAGKLKAGTINQEDFLIHSEVFCLDATVSAMSSVLGEVLIPIPVLGAVIGNVVGMILYGIVKDTVSGEEQRIILQCNQSRIELEETLAMQYRRLMGQMEEEIKRFGSLVNWAFSEDANIAFEGSVKLAEHCGVRQNRIRKNKSDIDDYFLT